MHRKYNNAVMSFFFMIFTALLFSSTSESIVFSNKLQHFFELTLLFLFILNRLKYPHIKLHNIYTYYALFLVFRDLIFHLRGYNLFFEETYKIEVLVYQYALIADYLFLTLVYYNLLNPYLSKFMHWVKYSLIIISIIFFFPYLIDPYYLYSMNNNYLYFDLKLKATIYNCILLIGGAFFFINTKKHSFRLGFFIQTLILAISISQLSELVSSVSSIVSGVTSKNPIIQSIVFVNNYIYILILCYLNTVLTYRLLFNKIKNNYRKIINLIINYIPYVMLGFIFLLSTVLLIDNIYMKINFLVVGIVAVTVIFIYLHYQRLRVEKNREHERLQQHESLTDIYMRNKFGIK